MAKKSDAPLNCPRCGGIHAGGEQPSYGFLALAGILATLLVIVLWLLSPTLVGFLYDQHGAETSVGNSTSSAQSHGAFGDQYGMINSLFSGLALAGMVITLFFQSMELKAQREELRASICEQAKAAVALEKRLEQENDLVKRRLTLDLAAEWETENFRLERRRATEVVSTFANTGKEFPGVEEFVKAGKESESINGDSVPLKGVSVSALQVGSFFAYFRYIEKVTRLGELEYIDAEMLLRVIGKECLGFALHVIPALHGSTERPIDKKNLNDVATYFAVLAETVGPEPV